MAATSSPTDWCANNCWLACPRCGDGHLFRGFLALKPSCEACGLDYGRFDAADGPAFFVMSIVGLVVVGIALWPEFAY